MRVMKIVIDHMSDTLEEAQTYYRDYIIYKESYPKMANAALEMSQIHLSLYTKWHDVVVTLINEYKMKHGDVPKTMQEIYDYEHKKLVEEYDSLNYKIKNARSM